ncbi:MAG TPA: RsmE family RNA methyltransferase [Candidatus Krumholzibacteria bacterium]|nr:RsmE family RNA methyltransferase [Candidatus Krumholzibacteria bacterium]
MEVQWLPGAALKGKSILLEGDEARHILKVRRRSVGDELLFTTGDGNFIHARIDRSDSHSLHAEVLRHERDEREEGRPRISLALALLKNDHFELALEKCVELGVHRVIPLLAEHCVVRWKAASADRKLERWRRIAVSAMKQSGRSWLPSVHSPVKLSELPELVEEEASWIVGDETERELLLSQLALEPSKPRVALVGPEGGFSALEREWLSERGALAVSLSSFRLRAETAAITLVSSLAAPRLTPGQTDL